VWHSSCSALKGLFGSQPHRHLYSFVISSERSSFSLPGVAYIVLAVTLVFERGKHSMHSEHPTPARLTMELVVGSRLFHYNEAYCLTERVLLDSHMITKTTDWQNYCVRKCHQAHGSESARSPSTSLRDYSLLCIFRATIPSRPLLDRAFDVRLYLALC